MLFLKMTRLKIIKHYWKRKNGTLAFTGFIWVLSLRPEIAQPKGIQDAQHNVNSTLRITIFPWQRIQIALEKVYL